MIFTAMFFSPFLGHADDPIWETDKETKIVIHFPAFPENMDLSEEFQLAMHFQERAIIYSIGEPARLSQAAQKNKAISELLFAKPYIVEVLDKMRSYWKKKWDIDLPEWLPLLSHPEDYEMINPFEYRLKKKENDQKIPLGDGMRGGMPLSGPKTKIDFGEKNLVTDNVIYVLSNPWNVTRAFLVFKRALKELYVVAGYQYFGDVAGKEDFDGYSARLRYLFLGRQPKRLNQGGKIFFENPFTGQVYFVSGQKTVIPNFLPTGSIILFDDQGHPTHYYSVKDGKYFGPQIKWDNKGNIMEFHNITEATQSCEDIWLEFTAG